jgi:hypothetical protein
MLPGTSHRGPEGSAGELLRLEAARHDPQRRASARMPP